MSFSSVIYCPARFSWFFLLFVILAHSCSFLLILAGFGPLACLAVVFSSGGPSASDDTRLRDVQALELRVRLQLHLETRRQE